MVGHDINNQAHAALLQALCEFRKLFLGTNFRIEASVIGDVVAVRAAGMSHQERRGVAVGDSQIMQVSDHHGCLGKRKTLVELKTVGRTGDISGFQ